MIDTTTNEKTYNPQRAFLDVHRRDHLYREMERRRRDFEPVELTLSVDELTTQAQRCMNCGIPFCHGSGCPLGNLIPDFNHAVVDGDWKNAWNLLASTSPFPEFTSRICPALCEGACTAGPNFGAVNIRLIEQKITETAWQNGWIVPERISTRNDRKNVAIIGSGPAGLAAAITQLRQGNSVTIYEKNHRPGGLLRYGIPDFKLSKKIIDRRIDWLKASGIRFVCDTQIGRDISAEYLASRNDSLILATGTPISRDLRIPGRELNGVHFSLELLAAQNRVIAGEIPSHPIDVRGKKVLVIGGGDTGSDCVGTSIRLGAASVTQIEIMPKPPAQRSASTPWPNWPYMLRTSSSHEEGCQRAWCLNTLQFVGDSDGKLMGADVVPVKWGFTNDGRPLKFDSTDEKPQRIDCDLVFLALGFLKKNRAETLNMLGIADTPEVRIVGDAANGPSLVVRAIADGMKL